MSDSGLSDYLRELAEAGVAAHSIPHVNSGAGLIKGLASLALDNGAGPTVEQSMPTRPALLTLLDEQGLARLLPGVARSNRLVLAACLLQIHEFWDASHDAAQKAEELGETRFSAYWHGIAHRREPDADNANYWFRRVGSHSTFPKIRDLADPVLQNAMTYPNVANLARFSRWDPAAMIELCIHPVGPAEADVARSVQRIELSVLTAATLDALL